MSEADDHPLTPDPPLPPGDPGLPASLEDSARPVDRPQGKVEGEDRKPDEDEIEDSATPEPPD
ncbi:hypothetical protein ACQEU5_23565 [Marinactinospora thermotolerans]|uniref:Uncharacterized protein n=1 Tax=Marinactinospora thermotolerans DSM 45154 TaxID=1122192 RepID=A0A1T4K5I2_9ACTN|nr:hypothetical protein [Marinactinospora thermotolerans]SJZ37671.1 hypothetical protein SAMN02745673_00177 [Marinactinospora thermotolerans DSM 45154]